MPSFLSPQGGAHNNPDEAYVAVEEAITKELDELSNLSPEELVTARIDKFSAMGVTA